MRRRGSIVGLAFAALAAIGCGGGSPAAPSPPSNISGAYSGTGSDSTGPGQVTWQLTQSSTAVNGSATAKTPLGTVVFTGTIAGTLSGSTLTFSVTVPAGGVSGSPSCAVAVNGTAAVTATTIAGTYSGNNTCSGGFTDGQSTLTKS